EKNTSPILYVINTKINLNYNQLSISSFDTEILLRGIGGIGSSKVVSSLDTDDSFSKKVRMKGYVSYLLTLHEVGSSVGLFSCVACTVIVNS
ncbi:MAG: hypothetical protein AAF705_15190, partial [Bacteroidota bacterium]